MEYLVSQNLLRRIIDLAGGPLWTTGVRASCRAAWKEAEVPRKFGDEEDLLIMSAISGDYGAFEFALAHGAIGYQEAARQAALYGRLNILRRLSKIQDLHRSWSQEIGLMYSALEGADRDVVLSITSELTHDGEEFSHLLLGAMYNYYSKARGLMYRMDLADRFANDPRTKYQCNSLAYVVPLYLFAYGFTGNEGYKARADYILDRRFAGDRYPTGILPNHSTLGDPVLLGAAWGGRIEGCVKARAHCSITVGYIGMGVAAISNRNLDMLDLAYQWLGNTCGEWVARACNLGYADILQWLFNKNDGFGQDCKAFLSDAETDSYPNTKIPCVDTSRCHEIASLHTHMEDGVAKYFTHQLHIAVRTLDYRRFKMAASHVKIDAQKIANYAVMFGNTWAFKIALKNGGHAERDIRNVMTMRRAVFPFLGYMCRKEVYNNKIGDQYSLM